MAAGHSRSHRRCRCLSNSRGHGPVALSVMAGKNPFARGSRAAAWWLGQRLWQGAARAGAITADTPAGRAFASFGPGSVIGFPAGAVDGQRGVAIGAGALGAAQG